jgi:hypothetical protein
MTERNEISQDTKHAHVGYLGPERLLPEEIFLASLTNRQEGVVNDHFRSRRFVGDSCEMDVIGRLYPDLLHRITQEQYLKVVVYGKLKEVLQELGIV